MNTEKNLYEPLCTTVTHNTAMYNSHSQYRYVQKIYSGIFIYQFSNPQYDFGRVFTQLIRKNNYNNANFGFDIPKNIRFISCQKLYIAVS